MIVSINIASNPDWPETRLLAVDYYRYLVGLGWGVYRIAREHGFEPIYPKLSSPLFVPAEGRSGYFTEAYIIDQLTHYLIEGGEILI